MKTTGKVMLVILGLLWGVAVVRAEVPDQTATLVTLRSLPKVLLSWAPAKFASDAELEQWTKVSQSCPISWWTSEQNIRKCVQYITEHGGLLSFSYSPMKKQYKAIEVEFKGDSEKIHLEKQMCSMDLGKRWTKERDALIARMVVIAAICKDNGVLSDRVVLMLDHESAVLNDMTVPAICHKVNELYDFAKSLGWQCFHYNYRGIKVNGRGEYEPWWEEWKQAPRCCKSDYAATSLYHPNEPHRMRQKMQKTLRNTSMDVVPFVSLGWRWMRVYVNGKEKKGTSNDYDLDYSSLLADDLHQSWKSKIPSFFYDNRRVPMISMWPGPGHHDNFWPHFYAYHRGAVRNSKAPRMEVILLFVPDESEVGFLKPVNEKGEGSNLDGT